MLKKMKVQNNRKRREREGYYIFLRCYAISHICIAYSTLHAFATDFRRSSKNVVLDDDDLELIRENKSINQEKLVSLCFFITSHSVYF